MKRERKRWGREMKGVQKIYHYSYIFTVLVLVLVLFDPALSISVSTMSSSDSLTISSNRTLVSLDGVFELGFFKPSERSHWYLGVWYKKVFGKANVWVANRDKPLSSDTGTLKISGNNLVLLDQSNNTVWTTNLGSGDVIAPVIGELLPNGNFVLRYSNDPSEFLWESFDFPTDTLLPGMSLGYYGGSDKFLTSWKDADDPTSGNFTYGLNGIRSVPQFILRYQHFTIRRRGPWDGLQFSGILEKEGLDIMVENFTDSPYEITYSFQMTNQSIYSRLLIRDGLTLELFKWSPPSQRWSFSWNLLGDSCQFYATCGTYAYCDVINASAICNCISGFVPKYKANWDLGDWSSGCVRRTLLNCVEGDDVYLFVTLNKTKLPDATMATLDRRIDVKKCEERCRSDCNCTAYAFGQGCLMWTGELIDIRTYMEGGHELYVKVSADDTDFSSGEKKDQTGKIIGWSLGGLALLFIMILIVYCFWKRGQKQAEASATPIVGNQVLMNEMVLPTPTGIRDLSREDELEDLDLPLMEFEAVVAATEHFSDSNMVGKGGFGVVYKGRLSDGQEIAVKRLSEMSAQGTHEFLTEVRLIARLQHRNLVRLLGCCVYNGERVLIYEYLENLGLDSHLFDEARSCMLNWEMRYNIINGIARGLLYLHQDSRFRIIHRDLKASNVLLDKDMTPKISDFGMARIFGRDETEANTRKVVGTYGYMSPEYAMNGTFSMKSDVFSFGVLLLEIISGKRNKGFCDSDSNLNLLSYVWKNWEEGQGLEIIDEHSYSSLPTFRPHEILRYVQVGLLCVQDQVEDRPLMSSVVLMLGSDEVLIPQPKKSVYNGGRSTRRTRRDEESCTVNQITGSIIDAR